MLFNKIYVSQIISDAVSQVEGFDFWSRDMSLPIARTLTTPNEEKSQGGAGNLTRVKVKCEVPNTEDSLHNEHKMNHQRTQYYQPITMLQDNILLQSIIRQ